MASEVRNPQEECLRALRELIQLDKEVYYQSSAVQHRAYHNGISLPDNVAKVNLEFFVATGDAQRVIISRGFAAENGNPKHKAFYAYRAVDKPNNPPAIMDYDGDSTPDPKVL